MADEQHPDEGAPPEPGSAGIPGAPPPPPPGAIRDAGPWAGSSAWQVPPRPRGPRIDIGSVAGRTFETYGAEWSLFLALSAPLALAYAAQSLLLSPDAVTFPRFTPELVLGGVATWVVLGLVAILSGVAIVRATDALWQGRPVTVAEIGRGFAMPAARAVALTLTVGLVVAAFIGLSVVIFLVAIGGNPGALLLLLPLVLVAIPLEILAWLRLSPAFAGVVLEPLRPLAALRHSWRITSGNTWLLFGLGVVFVLAGLLASWGASLFAFGGDFRLAGLATAFATLIVTPVQWIGYTIVWRDLSGRATADPPATPRPRSRAIAAVIVLGIGAALLVAGVGVAGVSGGPFGGSAFGEAFQPSQPGVALTGGSSGTDPCRPADRSTAFATGDEIWFGGYFADPPRTETGDVRLDVSTTDGALVASHAFGATTFFVPICFRDPQPFHPPGPGDYRIEVTYAGVIQASGTFTVAP